VTKASIPRFIFSVFLVCLLALGSQQKVGTNPEHAVLRLSWIHVGEKISKVLTQAELDDLPIHMRPQDGVLESESIPYVLEVSIDQEQLDKEIVNGAGLQGDRPMHVFKDYVVSPGEHSIEITFQPDHEVPDAIRYQLKDTVNFERGQIRTIGLIRSHSTLSIR
jgi:hypothetical protein